MAVAYVLVYVKKIYRHLERCCFLFLTQPNLAGKTQAKRVETILRSISADTISGIIIFYCVKFIFQR